MHGNVLRTERDDKRREQVLELVRENYSGEPEHLREGTSGGRSQSRRAGNLAMLTRGSVDAPNCHGIAIVKRTSFHHDCKDAARKAASRWRGVVPFRSAADLLQAWVRQYGVPKALYCDWKNVYQRQPTSREALRSSGACASALLAANASGSQGIADYEAPYWSANGSADFQTFASSWLGGRRWSGGGFVRQSWARAPIWPKAAR